MTEHKTYISSCRFDLMAKYLYIKFKEKGIASNFYHELYCNHMTTFNNCNEFVDSEIPNQKPKKCIEDFITSFDNLILSIKKNGFNSDYPITLGNNRVIVNGAHRLMVSYFYHKQPIFKSMNEPGNMGYNCDFFMNRGVYPSLSPLYMDTMALEYIKHNPNIRTMILYPTVYPHNKFGELVQIINQYAYIYYKKRINLTPNGVSNLIKEMYRGEDWIGGLFPKGFSPGGKAERCIGNNAFPTIILLLDMKDLSKCVELKEKCRNLFGLGKHSLHISDYTKDTFRIASSLLNENSIDYLNKGTNDISENTKRLLTQYFEKVGDDNEDYCLTSSIIMEMYGLRQAKDVDYLHICDKKIAINDAGIHDGKWLSYYHTHKHEIIYNTTNHFYFNGYKFANLYVIIKMKENRNEPKDQNDLELIAKFKHY